MVDETRVLRLLRGVHNTLQQLASEASASDSRRADALWLPGIKYLLITAIEGCIDAAQHVCGSEGWGPPSDNGNAMTILGAHGVLDLDLSRAMRMAVGFRNVLVHEYVDVDDSIVTTRLANLGDLMSFVDQVNTWMARTRS